ncbi:MAG: DUF4405 domain-containing protein [Ruminococcus flavefaciens]|nr:DUF4405 domain-containing protein [Ruminococcus flavefaciens]
MQPKQQLKILVDVLMTVGLLFLMGYHFWGDAAHEWVGAGMFVLFLLHHALNWRWWAGVFTGRYTAVRVFQLVIDLLVLAAMVGLMVSGIILSRKVFAFVSVQGGTAFARVLHMASAYWGFVLIAAHLGLHWGMLLGMARKFGKTQLSGKLPTLLGAAVAAYGVVALVRRGLPTYLLMQTEFVFFDYEESKVLFYLDYLAVMGTFIFLAHCAMKLLRNRKGNKPS